MTDAQQVQQQAALSLERLWPRLEITFRDEANAAPADWCMFERRLRHEWERLFGLLIGLYGGQYDFFYHLEEIVGATARSWLERPAWLKQLDARREADPAWFQSQLDGWRHVLRRPVCRDTEWLARPIALFQKTRTHLSAPDATIRIA